MPRQISAWPYRRNPALAQAGRLRSRLRRHAAKINRLIKFLSHIGVVHPGQEPVRGFDRLRGKAKTYPIYWIERQENE